MKKDQVWTENCSRKTHDQSWLVVTIVFVCFMKMFNDSYWLLQLKTNKQIKSVWKNVLILVWFSLITLLFKRFPVGSRGGLFDYLSVLSFKEELYQFCSVAWCTVSLFGSWCSGRNSRLEILRNSEYIQTHWSGSWISSVHRMCSSEKDESFQSLCLAMNWHRCSTDFTHRLSLSLHVFLLAFWSLFICLDTGNKSVTFE